MTAPVWGCPWHGLITNGQLELPNGQSMAWPAAMTGALECQAGGTHLIDIPGVPAVVRTSEEAAADAAAGRQWRRTAMLSGAGMSLHGTALAGWVYCAADGTRWHVPRSAFGGLAFGMATWSGSVTLRRFGVLGGSPDERVRPFVVAPQQPVIAGITAPINVDVHAVSPDGARAILMAYVRESALRSSGPSPLQQLPVGFYLVTLSGGTDDLALSVSVLYDQEQTLGDAGSEFPAAIPLDVGGGTSQIGPWHAYYRDRIVAAWFDGLDVLPVTWSMEWSGTINNPPPSGSPLSRTCTASTSMTWTLAAGDAVIDSITGSASDIIIQREPNEDEGQHDRTTTLTTEGETVTYSSAGAFGDWGGGASSWLLNSYGGASARGRLENSGWSMICADDADRLWVADIQRYSNNLLGLRLRKQRYADNTVAIDYRRAGRPGGVDGSTMTVAGSPSNLAIGHRPYGSYNPATGTLVRNQTDPVCWV